MAILSGSEILPVTYSLAHRSINKWGLISELYILQEATKANHVFHWNLGMFVKYLVITFSICLTLKMSGLQDDNMLWTETDICQRWKLEAWKKSRKHLFVLDSLQYHGGMFYSTMPDSCPKWTKMFVLPREVRVYRSCIGVLDMFFIACSQLTP